MIVLKLCLNKNAYKRIHNQNSLTLSKLLVQTEIHKTGKNKINVPTPQIHVVFPKDFESCMGVRKQTSIKASLNLGMNVKIGQVL